jgi:hypothetical protein
VLAQHDGKGTALQADSNAESDYVFEVDGHSLTVGGLAHFQSNSSSNSTRKLVYIENQHVSANGATCLYIQQDADQSCLHIEATGVQWQDVLYVRADDLKTGKLAYFQSNCPEIGDRDLVRIHNDNVLATGAICLELTQDSTNWAMTTTGGGINIVGGGLTIDGGADINLNDGGDLHILGGEIRLTSGAGMYLLQGADLNILQGGDIVVWDDGDIRIDEGELQVTSKGRVQFGGAEWLQIPRCTEAEINATSKVKGMLFYNTTYEKLQCWDGTLRNLY